MPSGGWYASRRCRCIAKWANGDGIKTAIAVTGCQLPLTIAGAFVIDLLLLALTLFVGQLLSDGLNGNNPTIAFQQSLFLNAFALIRVF